MVFAVFLIIISGFYAMINIYKPPLIDYTQEEVIRLSNALISDSGPDNWEEYNNTTINDISIMSSIGLAINKTVREDKLTYGILSYRKIENLSRIEYENARVILGLRDKGYDVNITLINNLTGNKTEHYFGKNLISGFSWERIVLVYNSTSQSYTSARFIVRLAKRG